MALTEGERLRQLLGESVPPGGTAEDTLFTDEAINDLLLRFPDDVEAQAREGYRVKAAALANLVNTAESGAKRDMSDLYDKAIKQWQLYGGGSSVDPTVTAGVGRVKIHNLTRSEEE